MGKCRVAVITVGKRNPHPSFPACANREIPSARWIPERGFEPSRPFIKALSATVPSPPPPRAEPSKLIFDGPFSGSVQASRRRPTVFPPVLIKKKVPGSPSKQNFKRYLSSPFISAHATWDDFGTVSFEKTSIYSSRVLMISSMKGKVASF